MRYLEISQKAKREIKLLSGIEAKLIDMLEGRVEPFSHGSSVGLYRAGKTGSGLYVALRAFKPEFLEDEGLQLLEDQIQWTENYCQNAAMHYKHNEDVPKFCIGVIYKDNAAILTEDLSEGGRADVTPLKGGDVEVTVTGPGVNRKKVYVDLDPHYIDLRPIPKSGIRYFADPNVKRIKAPQVEAEQGRELVLASNS